MPVGWESHSSPEMGNRPQAIINKQVLKDADFLIAVFWTRLGSPTGVAPSGTVEEIEEHIAAEKPTMIYFSSAPVRPDSIDSEQYEALKSFKATCKQRGLIEEYESIDEFCDKFRRQLAQKVIACCLSRNQQIDSDSASANQTQSVISALSEEAKELLINAAVKGSARRTKAIGGVTSISANNRTFNEIRDPRSIAKWQDALDQLMQFDLLHTTGGKIFYVTESGYQLADKLMAQNHQK